MCKYKSLSNYSLIAILFVFLAGCSSNAIITEGESYKPNDEISEGPGIFSGPKGAFYLVGNNKTVADNKSKESMNSKQAINAINEKLEQLKRDRMELEAFKRQLQQK